MVNNLMYKNKHIKQEWEGREEEHAVKSFVTHTVRKLPSLWQWRGEEEDPRSVKWRITHSYLPVPSPEPLEATVLSEEENDPA